MKQIIAVYPGTFDPISNGHLDLIKRGLRIFDKLIVAVASNPRKSPLFTIDERVNFIKEAVKGLKNIEVESFNGLLIGFAKEKGANVIVKGLRAVSDFEYELQMSLMNRRLDTHIETVFMMPSEEYSFLSSRILKEVASLNGDVSGMVPKAVVEGLRKKFKNETGRKSK
ncbi:MAG: pantetheine-phosphate adenylyltransferase [Nitrospinota bacterium]